MYAYRHGFFRNKSVFLSDSLERKYIYIVKDLHKTSLFTMEFNLQNSFARALECMPKIFSFYNLCPKPRDIIIFFDILISSRKTEESLIYSVENAGYERRKVSIEF